MSSTSFVEPCFDSCPPAPPASSPACSPASSPSGVDSALPGAARAEGARMTGNFVPESPESTWMCARDSLRECCPGERIADILSCSSDTCSSSRGSASMSEMPIPSSWSSHARTDPPSAMSSGEIDDCTDSHSVGSSKSVSRSVRRISRTGPRSDTCVAVVG